MTEQFEWIFHSGSPSTEVHMNKRMMFVAAVCLLLGMVAFGVSSSVQANTTPDEVRAVSAPLSWLAGTPTPSADRHDASVARYLQVDSEIAEPDRHDRNVLRLIHANWGTK
jgi:hypothetical protein